ncbi:MAG: DUF669 domain-containing protein [Lachnospiraceae bacterium]
MDQTNERAFGWDDEISKESDFITLPAGDYDFMIESYERGRYEPSATATLPACPMAIVSIAIKTPLSQSGKVVIKHTLYLHSRCEGFLSQFFLSIGLKKKGEPLRMNWQAVPGTTGRLNLAVEISKNGNQYNTVKKFYPKEENKGFTAGTF